MLNFESSVEKIVNREVGRRLKKLLEKLNNRIGHVSAAPNGHARVAITSKKARKATGNRQLQGKYMAAVRNLSAKDKAEIRDLRLQKGIRAAISEAKKMSEA